MQLSEIPEGSQLKLDTERGEEVVTFHHLDGMYSYITTEDKKVLHLKFNTPLRKEGDFYIIDDLIKEEISKPEEERSCFSILPYNCDECLEAKSVNNE